MKKILVFVITVFMLVSCSELENNLISDTVTESVQKVGSIRIVNGSEIAEIVNSGEIPCQARNDGSQGRNNGEMVVSSPLNDHKDDSGARVLDTGNGTGSARIAKVDIEVMGTYIEKTEKTDNGKTNIVEEAKAFTPIKLSDVVMSAGRTNGNVVIEGIPVGENRIVKVSAKNESGTVIAGLDMFAVCDIKENETNTVTVNWASTALGKVYEELLKKGKKPDEKDSTKESPDFWVDVAPSMLVQELIPSVHAARVDANKIATDIVEHGYLNKVYDIMGGESSETIDTSKYALDAGTVTVLSDADVTGVTLQVYDPISLTLSNLSSKQGQVIHDVAPGKWQLYVINDNGSILYDQAVTVKAGENTDVTVSIKVKTPIIVDKTGNPFQGQGIREDGSETIYLKVPGNDNATIYYTKGLGQEPANPTTSATLYNASSGIVMQPNEELKAMATASNMKPSDILYEYKMFKQIGALGLVHLEQGDYDYDKINIEWNEPVGADDNTTYNVVAYYTDDNTKTSIISTTGNTNATTTKEILDGGNKLKWKCEYPIGYDDAKKAGKNITVKVTATKSYSDGSSPDTQDDTIITHLIGPASVNVTKEATSDDKIIIRWEKIEGAKLYVVYRKKYADMAGTQFRSGYSNDHLLYILKDNGTSYSIKAKANGTTVSESDITASRIIVVNNGVTDKQVPLIKLQDIYCEVPEIAGQVSDVPEYQKMQDELAVGFPYAYYVMPVIKEDDINGMSFDDSNGKLTISRTIGGSSHVYSENGNGVLTPLVTASLTGYGTEVKATKAIDAEKIHIDWKMPYALRGRAEDQNLTTYIYRRLFNRGDGQPGSWVQITPAITKNDDNGNTAKIDDVLVVNGNPVSDVDEYASYEYAVSYKDAMSTKICATYLSNLKANLDNDARYASQDRPNDKEPYNKGYLNVPYNKCEAGAAPSYDGYDAATQFYSEKISIGYLTGGNDRVIRPDGYTYVIYMKNYNVDNTWHEVFELEADDLHISNNYYDANTDNKDKISVEKGNKFNHFFITPGEMHAKTKNQDGTTSDGYGTTGTNSPMKVLRDYKHYYKLVAKKNGTDIATYGDDGSVWACRNITDEELVKATMLVLGEVTKNGIDKTAWGAGQHEVYNKDGGDADDEGKVWWWQGTDSQIIWQLDDCRPKWVSGDNSPAYTGSAFVSVFNTHSAKKSKITDSDCGDPYNDISGYKSGDAWRTICGTRAYSFDNLVKVRVASYNVSDVVSNTYNGRISFMMSTWNKNSCKYAFHAKVEHGPEKGTLTAGLEVKVGDGNSTSEDLANVMKWSPIGLNWNGYKGRDSSLGWWPVE